MHTARTPAELTQVGDGPGVGDRGALADTVYVGLLDEIISGVHAPGSRLKERDVSERFAVSRVPVRQAIHRLEAEGFVLTEPNRGAVVRRVSTSDVDDLFEARLCIEPYGAGLAGRRVAGGAADTTHLERLIQIAGRYPKPAAPGLSAALEIHAEIIRLSGNQLLLNCLGPMLGRMEWIFRLTKDVRDQHTEHEQLTAAIVAGNGELAAHLAYTHIELGRAPIMDALRPILEG